jgi:hypothetical protein
MLEFAEHTQLAIRRLREQTAQMLMSGGVKDMEQYRFLMGRLEGYRFVEDAIKELLIKNNNLQD